MSNPHEPTVQTKAKVTAFCCAGFTHEEVAEYLSIDKKTLYKYYKDELAEAKYEKIGEISDVAFQLAKKGDVKMIEFVLKCRGHWHYYKPPEQDKSAQVVTLLESIVDKLS